MKKIVYLSVIISALVLSACCGDCGVSSGCCGAANYEYSYTTGCCGNGGW